MRLKREHIREEWSDSDGYWIALRSGVRVVGEILHTIHEDTRREAYSIPVEKCDCRECAADAAAK